MIPATKQAIAAALKQAAANIANGNRWPPPSAGGQNGGR